MAAMSTTQQRRWTPRRIVLLVLGVIAVLIALGLLAGGGALLWAHEGKRDADGYFSTSIHHVNSRGFAVATHSLDVATVGPSWLLGSRQLARIRIEARSERPIFVGVARASDVASYLGSVSYTRVSNVDWPPLHVDYAAHSGAGRPVKPEEKRFWVAFGGGGRSQIVNWDLKRGKWSVVVMNADGSPRVFAELSVGADVGWLIWLIVGLLVVGTVVLFGGALLIFSAVRSPPKPGATPVAGAS
jgi:hypothetical protein